MPPLSHGRGSFQASKRGAAIRIDQRGVTLLELLIVMTLIALMTGIAYPSASAGIDSMRLRSTSDHIARFLSTAIDRAERSQQVVEVWISPKDGALMARSPDLGFARRFEVPAPYSISAVYPAAGDPGETRRFLMYPGGTVPRIGVEISSGTGRKRLVTVDSLTGMPRSEAVAR